MFAFLASSITQSTSASVMFSATMVNGPVSLCRWSNCVGDPPGESEFCRSRISFGRPLPSVPLLCIEVIVTPLAGVEVVGVTGDASQRSQPESWILNNFGDLTKRPSGPRSPVPLLLGSCVSCEKGLLICFLRKIFF